MATLTAGDVTVTIDQRHILGKLRMNVCKIDFGNAALTYPSGGVPMPAMGIFGMSREILGMQWLDEASADGFKYKYDRANRTIRIYTQGVTLSAAGTAILDDHAVTAGVGVSAISLGVTVPGAGTYRLGAMKELVTTEAAPAATTIWAMVWGR